MIDTRTYLGLPAHKRGRNHRRCGRELLVVVPSCGDHHLAPPDGVEAAP